MKSSLFLAAASAMLATASPLGKRAMHTDWVYEVVTVTVTAGAQAAAVPTGVFVEHKHTPKPKPTPTYVPPPPPPVSKPQTTTQAPPPPPPQTTTSVAPKQPAPEPKPTTSAAPAPAPAPPSDGSYESTMLYRHNIHRSNHSAGDLTWDSTLAQYAENTAKTCVFEHDMNQGSGGYGQNLASWGTSGALTDDSRIKAAAGGVSNQWYNSEMLNWQFYGLDNPPSSSSLYDWGHFTQVVWKDVTKVGCATVKCASGTVLSMNSWYTVCNYNPPGNYGGQYGKNVLKPLGHSISSVSM
ncbi:SCP-like extracellular protein [Purpureocillium lilacinum]|nr:SCP-like extracellular protein [Purpureocillium lilacinum]OAQ85103.1 SCP-like extracellular protein [Purpureocillium lilacinum]OAQ89648.1 SCP-like extracellular protein [Purpureocillium lilacinum]GJN69344.1 hypothetical protein PLICBS_003392 [Purpureocillium lilacinum]GJN76978.1 hypothetical protein PLIIFM63780_000466 [Purpureocillium lilacinum]